ncbi:putative fatty acyl-CoA reductase CG5065 [Manduca sexta]|uniref:putative fatty acyl-CoA reductase CG5065 n=1 Tax=Manduca sexta TaxID=7130 RepID=UPI00188DFE7B|nr:putative fatty acyl-CoA reductase CG5065 [Manduca sexta]XP_030041064.2 putative fatty acyl-CoA reductase CG5065 [Manduca sexta]
MAQSVPDFYKGKNVFITGGTGFVGKSLVEKLLRSCPEVNSIYLLLRQKKGLSTEERLRELCNNKLFDLLRQQNPEFCKKLRLVAGDITMDGLGLSDKDREELSEKCHIVFHSAACVRFDQKLKDALIMNTTGTLRVLTLAETMKNLEVFVHVSTAYCRCDLPQLCERLYPAVHSPRRLLQLLEWMDDDTLAYLEPKLIASEPNTYSYTKAVTEDLVDEFSSKFPIAIARPSIVTAAWKEPIPGWVDNLNGPTGLLIGSGKGVIRTMHCEPSYTADAVAVDVVANACILIAYVTAQDKPKETQFYNLTLSKVIKISWDQIIKLGEKWVNEYPYSMVLWYPGGTIKSYWVSHQLCLLLTHLLPAYLVDSLLFLLGKKTFMVNLQKRISHGLGILQYYTTKEWHFRNENYRSLQQRVSKEDNETFYTDMSTLDPDEYLKYYVLGTREFVCKESPDTLPRARRLHRIRFFADRIVKFLFLLLVFWFLYSYRDVFSSSVGMLDSALKSLPPLTSVRAEDS